MSELWIFDPLLSGPTSHGGPYRLQVWRREDDELVRVYAGDGPVRSQVLGASVVPVDEGRKLRISEDAEGTRMWRTAEETERSAKGGRTRSKGGGVRANRGPRGEAR